jgi:hypothetical protein
VQQVGIKDFILRTAVKADLQLEPKILENINAP